MASPVSDDVACFDSLPDDLVGVIMGKLDFPSAVRLTQACPAARRLVQGERAVEGVLGKVTVELPRKDDERDLRVKVIRSGLRIREAEDTTGKEAATDGEEDAERQPSACIVHVLEWIQVRLRAFTEIVVETSIRRAFVRHLADTFLPNVPSSYRGRISFEFSSSSTEPELEHVTNFLAAWGGLSPAYECGLALGTRKAPSDLLLASLQAAPPLSSLTVPEMEGRVPDFEIEGRVHGFEFLEKLDTSRLTELDTRSWMLEDLPSKDVLPPAVRDLALGLRHRCWSSLGAFLAPLHRLTTLKLRVSCSKQEQEQLNSSLTLAPFTVLPNLRVLDIFAFEYFGSPAVGSDYWQSPIVLPALEEMSLMQLFDDKGAGQGGQGGPAPGQPPRWPTLLSNLVAPKLERLEYCHYIGIRTTTETETETVYAHDRTLDLPLGRFPRLRYFGIHADALLDLPALRAEVATLRHLERPGSIRFFSSRRSVPHGSHIPDEKPSEIRYSPKDPLPEDEVMEWEVELGFRVSWSENEVVLAMEACRVPMFM